MPVKKPFVSVTSCCCSSVPRSFSDVGLPIRNVPGGQYANVIGTPAKSKVFRSPAARGLGFGGGGGEAGTGGMTASAVGAGGGATGAAGVAGAGVNSVRIAAALDGRASSSALSACASTPRNGSGTRSGLNLLHARSFTGWSYRNV